MIAKGEVIPLLTDASPSFQYDEEVNTTTIEGLQQELKRFASHLISLEFNNQLAHESEIFETIERLYTEGEAEVKESITIGLFETMYEMLSEQHITSEEIGRLLKPHSFKWWKTIEQFNKLS
ncbi:hypothetical protein P8864_18175 [Priestia flexa]|uniref:DUF7674 family protein n=1 Tax=Priestia flexa TaxID=86664 RepID=UPI000C24513C|nr:hypothetical protein [Priestia flexa]MEC0667784.1 hypothetical protein [Priestia flexa]